MIVVFKMRESVPSVRYSSVHNVLCLLSISLIPILIESTDSMILYFSWEGRREEGRRAEGREGGTIIAMYNFPLPLPPLPVPVLLSVLFFLQLQYCPTQAVLTEL